MYARIAIAVLVAALATACGGSSKGGDTSTTGAAGPDPATTKCSEFATMDAAAQQGVVEQALQAKDPGNEVTGAETMLPMVVGLCAQLPDATVSEVLAGPAVATTSAVPAPPVESAPATP
ncbi:MAG: hypothetical protein ACSLE6_14160 [Mycobacterium sp.]